MTNVAISELLTEILEPSSVRSSGPRALKKKSYRISAALSRQIRKRLNPKPSILFRGSRPTSGERRGGLDDPPHVPGTPPLRRRRETLALRIVRAYWLARGRSFCLRPDPPADASDAFVFRSLCASSASFSSSRRCRFSAITFRHRPRRLPLAFGAGRSRRDASREVWFRVPSAFAGRAVPP